jgi:hypothetical protein
MGTSFFASLFSLSLFLFFWDNISRCSLGWPGTRNPPWPPKCWDYRLAPPHLACMFFSYLDWGLGVLVNTTLLLCKWDFWHLRVMWVYGGIPSSRKFFPDMKEVTADWK